MGESRGSNLKPDREVTFVGELIYQCAKIIAKGAFGVPGGGEAKGRNYGFVIGRGSRVAGERGRRRSSLIF